MGRTLYRCVGGIADGQDIAMDDRARRLDIPTRDPLGGFGVTTYERRVVAGRLVLAPVDSEVEVRQDSGAAIN